MGTPSPEPLPRCQVCGASYAGGERFCSIDGGAIVVSTGAATDPLIGRTIDGRYLVRRPLGKGGMGVVYEADHVGLDKAVAIKFLLDDDDDDADGRARFRREARVASRIVHEHVVQIYDVGSHDGRDYIVMELVVGRDLRQTIAEDGPFEVARAIAIAVQMLRGLHAIHQAGIIHRDIKPANVLLTARDGDAGFVKIMDFGISKSVVRTAAVGTLTDTGKVVGTPQFMAPEQLTGMPFDHRADLYAVGLTLYAMLVGEAPFVASSFTRMAGLHTSVEAPSLDTFRPGLPRALVAAVARVLEKAPAARFADAAELADALATIDLDTTVDHVAIVRDAALSAVTVAARPSAPAVGRAPVADPPAAAPASPIAAPAPRAGSRRGQVVVAVAVVALALVAGGVALWSRHASAPHATGDLATAQAAERDGKLELAIAAYEAAYATDRTPPTLIRIAELHERRGERAAASAALTRYLEAAPDAPDRDVVRGRIAMLEPVAPVAPIAIAAPPDAAVAIEPAAPADARGATTAPSGTSVARAETPPRATSAFRTVSAPTGHQYCVCVMEGRFALCPSLGKPSCKCTGEVEGRDGAAELCAQPFVPCTCAPDDAKCKRGCDAVDPTLRCPRYVTIAALRYGGTCSGYHPITHAVVNGDYGCDACSDLNRRAYRGGNQDRCDGFVGWTGAPAVGELNKCEPAPTPYVLE